jgi:Phage integrase family
VPLVARTARTIDLAVGERASGPILLRHDGGRPDPRTARRWVRSIGSRAGLDGVHPHMLRAAFIVAALDAGVPLRDVQLAARHADLRTTTIKTGDARTSTATPPTRSSPSSPTADQPAVRAKSGRRSGLDPDRMTTVRSADAVVRRLGRVPQRICAGAIEHPPPWSSRHIDGSASACGEAPPIVAFPTPPAIKTDPRPNVAARRSALMV